MTTIMVRVRVLGPDAPEPFTVAAEWSETLAALLARVHLQYYLRGQPAQWRFQRDGETLPLEAEVHTLRWISESTVELELIRVESSDVHTMPGAPSSGVRPIPPSSGKWKVPTAESRPPSSSRVPVPPVSAPRSAPGRMSSPATELGSDEYDYMAGGVRTPVERRATVRYYDRMNPQKTFPLLVILSEAQIAMVKKRAVRQAESKGFRVEDGSSVEIEPVLPGCDCYPPKESVSISSTTVRATFWVVPHVLGTVQGARVVVRQNGNTLAEVPLDVRVRRQTLSVVFGVLGLASPYLMMGLKAAKLDLESQQADGFRLYQQFGNWLLTNVSPSLVGLLLLVAAAVSFWWARPRSKDVFWEVKPV